VQLAGYVMQKNGFPFTNLLNKEFDMSFKGDLRNGIPKRD
jgi:hypothetical protein